MADADSLFKSLFSSYQTSLKATSFDKEHEEYLCNDESHKYVYDFDEIVKNIYPSQQPSSYDALFFHRDNIYCVEFKNQNYSDIDRQSIAKKLTNGRNVLNEIFEKKNISKSNYNFIYCVAYKNTPTRWRRGIEKNTIQFELASYKGEYFDEIYTNDVQYFTHEYKKHFTKELVC